ncbi:heavy metal translocating P-type ATPase [Lacticaseibacillus jixiensis]|uniref:heavy metal translocating P-type ATPase n=1 Tax=Lacticaseibacillus jixiensis TaxID=3231926 RepID=UPI0036F2A5EC
MKHNKQLFAVLGVGAVALLLQYGLHQARWAQILITVLGALIALVMFVDMVKVLRRGDFGVDLLAITAVVATLAVGEYWAALIVLLMLSGGETLEAFAARKANSDLQQLLVNTPTTAHQVVNGDTKQVAADALVPGDTIVVRPGELVPVDAQVAAGSSTVDEASLTGEARPIDKTVGDTVMSGSVNGDGALTLTVTHTAADSQYQSIVKLVAQAADHPAHFVRMADRYALPFTIVAYVIAAVAWWWTKDPSRIAQVLVVASPCPLILAAPVAMVSGMSRASRAGIIVKSGTVLEKMAAARTFAFDKTGTLTKGVLEVDQVLPADGLTEAELVGIAAAAEQQSAHILARSLVAYAPGPLPVATDVKEIVGQGVAAQVAGHAVKVGQARFIPGSPTLSQTAIYVGIDDRYAGAITFSDTLRDEAAATITRLHEQGVADTMMISGDQVANAENIAKHVGIDHVFAECLPAAKVAVLEDLPEAKRPVVMVGDGVNDAPSLAAADVGIAMGAHGATAASESADVVILRDDLMKVATARTIGHDTLKVAKEAVIIGIAICTVLMLFAAVGFIPTIIGALLQEVIDTVTILYALRARH